MMPGVAPGTPPDPLTGFLVGVPGEPPEVATLRREGVSALAFVRLPEHPDRNALRADFVRASARHLAVRQAVARLVAAWSAADVEVLLFKGFALAEFVYAAAAERSYADIDVAVRPERVATACAVGEAEGWQLVWHVGERDHARAARTGGYAGHEAAQLRHPELDVTLDLHRRLAHNNHNRRPRARAQQRITDAAWAASRPVAWGGGQVRLLDPRDAVVVGLAVNRGWGSDGWFLKARDYPDFAALVERHGLTADALRARARELGVPRTFELFLRRCDPFRRHLRLADPSWWALRGWNARVAAERGWVDLDRGLMRLPEVAVEAAGIARALPTVWRHARSPERAPAAVAGPGVGAHLRAGPWRHLRRAIHRSLRLLGVPEGRRGEVAVRAAHDLLRRRGFDAGLEVAAGQLVLTLDGAALDARAPEGDEG